MKTYQHSVILAAVTDKMNRLKQLRDLDLQAVVQLVPNQAEQLMLLVSTLAEIKNQDSKIEQARALLQRAAQYTRDLELLFQTSKTLELASGNSHVIQLSDDEFRFLVC